MIVYLYRTHSYRRTGKQHVANLQRTELADVCDNLIYTEKHVLCISLLHSLSVNIQMEIDMLNIRYEGYLEQIHAPAEYLEQVNVLQESVSDLTIKTKDLKPFRFRL